MRSVHFVVSISQEVPVVPFQLFMLFVQF